MGLSGCSAGHARDPRDGGGRSRREERRLEVLAKLVAPPARERARRVDAAGVAAAERESREATTTMRPSTGTSDRHARAAAERAADVRAPAGDVLAVGGECARVAAAADDLLHARDRLDGDGSRDRIRGGGVADAELPPIIEAPAGDRAALAPRARVTAADGRPDGVGDADDADGRGAVLGLRVAEISVAAVAPAHDRARRLDGAEVTARPAGTDRRHAAEPRHLRGGEHVRGRRRTDLTDAVPSPAQDLSGLRERASGRVDGGDLGHVGEAGDGGGLRARSHRAVAELA